MMDGWMDGWMQAENNIWSTLTEDIIASDDVAPIDSNDTCKSVTMWGLSLFGPNNCATPPPPLSIFSAKLKDQFFTFSFDLKAQDNTMEDDRRRNLPSPAESLDPQVCSCELPRTNSDISISGVTIESFRDPSRNAIPGQTTVWTNEKHNSYLDFLEASFVKQLNCYLNLHGFHPQEEMQEPCPTQELPDKGHDFSHQFSVLQNECFQKINYKNNDPLLESTADSCDIMGSPWLHHFTATGKSSAATFPVPGEFVIPNNGIYLRSNTKFSHKSERSSEQHPIFHSCNHSGCCTSEVSDQNFVDEDQGEKTSCVAGVKRLKMAMLDASGNGQALPHGNLHTVDDSIMKNATSKRVKKKLMSNHPESFSCQKSDIHYFLRGS